MKHDRIKIGPDVAAGLLFALIGATFLILSTTGLKIGSAFRMGPGFFPAVVGGLLAVLGVVIAAKGVLAGDVTGFGTVRWRAVLLLPLALISFGLAMRPLGLVVALLILCLMASFANVGMTLRRALLISSAMTVLCLLIFRVGLGIELPLFGYWLR
jgi:hypothetical protein